MAEQTRFVMPGKEPHDRRDFVTSLAKGLSILSAFDLQRPRMTLSEVAAAVGMTRATARRYLLTLTSLGYVAVEERSFHLTPRVLNLGYAYIASVPILDIVTPVLEDLAAITGLVTGFSIVSNDELVTLAHGSVSRFVATGMTIGTTRPAYSTSSGRAILACWDDADVDAYLKRTTLQKHTSFTITDRSLLRKEIATARQRGYAVVDQEADVGIRGIAAPVFDSADNVLGAIVCVANPAVTSIEELETRIAPMLQEAVLTVRQSLPIYK